MGISGKFLKIWRKHFMVISTSVYSLVLVVLEHSIDPNFKCPEDEMQRYDYSLCYILLPPAALFLLGLAVQLPWKREDSLSYECYKCYKLLPSSSCIKESQMKTCERIVSILFKAFVPALLWLIIVLLDGKYIDCLCKSPKVRYPAAMTPYHVSQISGLGLIACIALVGSIYWCCRNCWREKVTMNVSQSKGRLRVQATNYLNEQQNEVIRKLIEKHLNNRYLAAPGTFVTGLSDEEISAEITQTLSALWENQSLAGRAQSEVEPLEPRVQLAEPRVQEPAPGVQEPELEPESEPEPGVQLMELGAQQAEPRSQETELSVQETELRGEL